MKIILADVHGPVCGKDQPSANLSLLYLAAYARQVVDNLDFTYLPQRFSLSEHLSRVTDIEPDVYAISFTSFSARVACSMIHDVKRLQPRTLIVAGGAHVNSHAQQLLEAAPIDLCVVGEGEVTFAEILLALPEINQLRSSIHGVAYLENKQFIQTASRSLIPDLDTIPFPARDLICQDDFVGISYSKATPNTEVVTTRGCPLRCTFCANPVFRERSGPRFRSRSTANIVHEVEELYQAGYREIYFHSDEINVELEWSIQLCKDLVDLNHKDLFFQTNLRANPMNEELASWLSRAGFWLVRMGVESANPRVLNGIRKHVSIQDIESACGLLAANHLTVFAFLMMFNFWEEDGDLCHESPDEVRNTINYVNSLRARHLVHLTSWQVATPTPGAEMYDVACRHNLITKEYLPDETWYPYQHFRDISRWKYKMLFSKARWQTARCVMSEGVAEWKNWRRILGKGRALIGM